MTYIDRVVKSSAAGRRKKWPRTIEPLESRHMLAGDVLITEFMASNDSTLLDENDQSSDWIELYNNSKSIINLDGWHLTDDEESLTKWQLPAVDLAAGAYKIVFASDKDRAIAGS